MSCFVLLKNNSDFLLDVESYFTKKDINCKYIPEPDLSKKYEYDIIIAPVKKGILSKIERPGDVIIFYPDKDDIGEYIPENAHWVRTATGKLENIYALLQDWLDHRAYVDLVVDDTKNDSIVILQKCLESCTQLNNFFNSVTVITNNKFIESCESLGYEEDSFSIINLANNSYNFTTDSYLCLLDSRYRIDFECVNNLIKLYNSNKAPNRIVTNVADKVLVNGDKIKNYIGQSSTLWPVSSKGTIYPRIKNLLLKNTDTIEKQILNSIKDYRVIHSLDISSIDDFKIKD